MSGKLSHWTEKSDPNTLTRKGLTVLDRLKYLSKHFKIRHCLWSLDISSFYSHKYQCIQLGFV